LLILVVAVVDFLVLGMFAEAAASCERPLMQHVVVGVVSCLLVLIFVVVVVAVVVVVVVVVM
jgi:hypothetical protein